jgi:hypothetical protein
VNPLSLGEGGERFDRTFTYTPLPQPFSQREKGEQQPDLETLFKSCPQLSDAS